MDQLFPILHEDDELLVVNKPAGLVCHPTKTDEYSSLIGRVRLYLGPRVHPHLVNRLDRETSGVVIVAKQGDAARRLGKIWESRQVEKEYLALVHGQVAETHAVIDAPLGKDAHSRVAIKDCVRSDGAPAQTEYWVQWHFGESSVLRARPQTGRKHQIRIHLAHIGHPIVGDKLYGGDEDLYLALVEGRLTPTQRQTLILPHHALHACMVRFEWRGERAVFRTDAWEWLGLIAAQLERAGEGTLEAPRSNIQPPEKIQAPNPGPGRSVILQVAPVRSSRRMQRRR